MILGAKLLHIRRDAKICAGTRNLCQRLFSRERQAIKWCEAKACKGEQVVRWQLLSSLTVGHAGWELGVSTGPWNKVPCPKEKMQDWKKEYQPFNRSNLCPKAQYWKSWLPTHHVAVDIAAEHQWGAVCVRKLCFHMTGNFNVCSCTLAMLRLQS